MNSPPWSLSGDAGALLASCSRLNHGDERPTSRSRFFFVNTIEVSSRPVFATRTGHSISIYSTQ